MNDTTTDDRGDDRRLFGTSELGAEETVVAFLRREGCKCQGIVTLVRTFGDHYDVAVLHSDEGCSLDSINYVTVESEVPHDRSGVWPQV